MLLQLTRLILLAFFCYSRLAIASEPVWVDSYPVTGDWFFHLGDKVLTGEEALAEELVLAKEVHKQQVLKANSPSKQTTTQITKQISEQTKHQTHWQTVTVPSLLDIQPTEHLVGWYAVRFDVPHQQTQQPKKLKTDSMALYIAAIRHADETWLNGVKIGQTGSITRMWDFAATNPQNSPRLYVIPNGLLKPQGNVLAIKVNTGFGKAIGAIYPGGTGISAKPIEIGRLSTLQKKYNQHIMKIVAMDMVFILLGLFDLFLILMLLRHVIDPFPEYKWLLISSVLMCLGVVAHDIFFLFNIGSGYTNSIYIVSLMLLPTFNAMYFWSLHRNVPKRIMYAVMLLSILLCTLMLTPKVSDSLKAFSWMFGSLVNGALFLYILYIAIVRVWQRHTGARIQLFGFVVYVLSIRSQWLPQGLFEHRNIQLGSLVFRYALLFAYIQQIHHLRDAYQQTIAKLLGIVETTRQNIARELHDGIGQHLASAKLFINIMNQNAADEVQKKQTQIIHDEVSDAIVGVRRAIVGLHAATLEKHTLVAAIQQETIKLEQLYDVKIAFHITEQTTATLWYESKWFKKEEHVKNTAEQQQITERFSAFQKAHIFRLFQECTHNAIYHGKASEINVSLKMKKHHAELIIKDNGQGFDNQPVSKNQLNTSTSGYGMINLAERVALLHARMSIKSQVNKGTQVWVTIPLGLNGNEVKR